MDRQEIMRMRKSVEAEYAKKLQQLEEERQGKLGIINSFLELYDENQMVGTSTSSTTTTSTSLTTTTTTLPPTVSSSTLSDFVRDLIKKIDTHSDFSIHTIRRMSTEIDPSIELSRNVLHNIIKEHVDKNMIKLVQQGKGRSPSLYRKMGQLGMF